MNISNMTDMILKYIELACFLMLHSLSRLNEFEAVSDMTIFVSYNIGVVLRQNDKCIHIFKDLYFSSRGDCISNSRDWA